MVVEIHRKDAEGSGFKDTGEDREIAGGNVEDVVCELGDGEEGGSFCDGRDEFCG